MLKSHDHKHGNCPSTIVPVLLARNHKQWFIIEHSRDNNKRNLRAKSESLMLQVKRSTLLERRVLWPLQKSQVAQDANSCRSYMPFIFWQKQGWSLQKSHQGWKTYFQKGLIRFYLVQAELFLPLLFPMFPVFYSNRLFFFCFSSVYSLLVKCFSMVGNAACFLNGFSSI